MQYNSEIINYRAFSSNFGKNWEKMIDLTGKSGEINDIEHDKGNKIYPKIQVILDCIMPTIPLKHKCLSIILIWVIVSHKYIVVVVSNYFLIWENRHGIGIKCGYFRLGMGRNWEKSIGQPMAKGSSMLTYMYKENETEDVI